MSLDQAYRDKMTELILKVFEDLKGEYELYDFDLSANNLLRVDIVKAGTQDALIEHCIDVDRAFTPHVEEADWIRDDFTLEVSSPGAFRVLKTQKHFEDVLNKRILVVIKSDLQSIQDHPFVIAFKKKHPNKTKMNVIGDLYEVEQNHIGLKEESTQKDMQIALDDLIKANLEPNI